MKTLTKEAQSQISPQQSIELLKAGNRRFVENLSFNRNLKEQLAETKGGQHPFAVIISCMDSRAPVELIFDQGLGDVFSIRIAGNIINDDILGSAEFGCMVVGAKAVLVLGHSSCGAIDGALKKVQLGYLGAVLNKIEFSIPHDDKGFESLSHAEKMELMTKKNVLHSISEIRNRSAILRDLEADGQITLVGGVFNLESGIVKFFEGTQTSVATSEKKLSMPLDKGISRETTANIWR